MKDSSLKKLLNPSLYRRLCLGRNATLAMIKKNYRGMVKITHSDRNPNDPYADDETQKLNEAYGILSSSILKPRYDLFLDQYELEKAQKERKRILEKQREKVVVKQKSTQPKKNTLNFKLEPIQNNVWLKLIRDTERIAKEFAKKQR
jgi:curved DNA-binding protein CbpA